MFFGYGMKNGKVVAKWVIRDKKDIKASGYLKIIEVGSEKELDKIVVAPVELRTSAEIIQDEVTDIIVKRQRDNVKKQLIEEGVLEEVNGKLRKIKN